MCAAVYRWRHLVRATKVNAGLAESNGRLLLGIWRDSLHVTCGLTVCTPVSAPCPTLGNEYGKTLPFTFLPAIRWLSRTRCTHGHHTAKRRRKCTHRLACNFAKCSMIKKTDRPGNKPFVVWCHPLSLRYVFTLPCIIYR